MDSRKQLLIKLLENTGVANIGAIGRKEIRWYRRKCIRSGYQSGNAARGKCGCKRKSKEIKITKTHSGNISFDFRLQPHLPRAAFPELHGNFTDMTGNIDSEINKAKTNLLAEDTTKTIEEIEEHTGPIKRQN